MDVGDASKAAVDTGTMDIPPSTRSSPSSRNRSHITPIEDRGFSNHLLSLRGIAALLVLIFHAAAIFTIDGQQPDDRMYGLPNAGTAAALTRQWMFFLTNGHAAVTFFFVHSGFVLTLAFSRSQPQVLGVNYIGYIASYYIKRLFRLWPMVVVSCLALWAYHRLGIASSSDDLFSIAFRGAVASADKSPSLAQNILLETTRLNPFQWSIAIEAVGSIVMPLLYLLGLVAFRTYCFLALLYVASVVLPLGQPVTTLDTVPVDAARIEYIFCMMVGSLLVFAQAWLVPIFRTKRRHILAVGAAIILLLARWFVPDFRSAIIVEICAASTIVLTVYYFDTGPLQTVCRLRIIKFYGMISYSFYSNSILAIRIAGPLTVGILGKQWVQGHGLPATLLAIAFALTINTPLSWLTYRLVERPLTNMGRQIGGIVLRRYADGTQPAETMS